MSGDAAVRDLFDRVLESDDAKLRRFAAEGLLPLEPARLATLQLALACSGDTEVETVALESLRRTDPRILAEVADEAPSSAVAFLCEQVAHPLLLEGVLQRREVEPELLISLASWLPEDLQEALLLRQEDIRANPEILDRLEANPKLGAFARRRIGEYRQHLLPRMAGDEEEARIEVTEEEVAEAISRVSRSIQPEGEVDEQTGLSESQIRSLPVGVRIRLAFGASRSLRNILLVDTNRLVAVAALKHGSMSELEVERLCRSRKVCQDVLAEIARNRRWIGRYGVVLGLVKNPRTPEGLVVRLVPRVAVRDLRMLRIDHGVSQAVRALARRIYYQKTS